jgi:hypothetical protein
MRPNTIETLFERVIYSTTHEGCWEWTGYKDKDGYGIIVMGNKNRKVHRVVYEHYNGKLPSNKILVCHTCDNPPCCNPNHLVSGSTRDNAQDMLKRGRAPSGGKLHSLNNHPTPILCEDDIINIIDTVLDGDIRPVKQISREYGVGEHAIRDIIKRKTWKKVWELYNEEEYKQFYNDIMTFRKI